MVDAVELSLEDEGDVEVLLEDEGVVELELEFDIELDGVVLFVDDGEFILLSVAGAVLVVADGVVGVVDVCA